VRAVATRNNVNVHDVSVQDLDGSLHVEQHLEMDEQLPLKEAHDRVTLMEDEIRTTGAVAIDETKLAYIQVRFSGFIEKVFVDAT